MIKNNLFFSKKIDQSPVSALDNPACSLKSEYEEQFLTTHEAAKFLKVPVGSLRNMSSNGQVPYLKLGNRNRYKLSDLKRLLLANPRGGNYGY